MIREETNYGASKGSFDKKTFVSELAAAWFEEDMINKTLVPKRGIELPEDHRVTHEIAKMGWMDFTKQPDAVVVPIVREFYANALDIKDESKVYVRQKWVSFDAATINKFCNLEAPEDQDSEFDLGKDVNLLTLTKKIAVDGAQWDKREEEPVNLKPSLLRTYCRAWFSFIGVKLMPTTHYSTLNKEHAVMIYDIVSGRPLNVGAIIESSILTTVAQQTTGGLGHPHLITSLCRDAGVKWRRNEKLLQPTKAIDMTVVKLYKPRHQALSEHVPKMSFRRKRSKVAEVGDRVAHLEDEVTGMRAELRELYAYNVEFNNAISRAIKAFSGSALPCDVIFLAPPEFASVQREGGQES